MRKIIIPLVLLVVIAGGAGYYFYSNQNSSELDQRFATHDSASEEQIDHSEWQLILDDYLVSDTESGVNLFDYEGLLDDGREPLDDYIETLEDIDPLTLNDQEQKAYWINLYNSLTAQLILDNYPLASITNLGSNPLEFGLAALTLPLKCSLQIHWMSSSIRPLPNTCSIRVAFRSRTTNCICLLFSSGMPMTLAIVRAVFWQLLVNIQARKLCQR